MHFAGTVLKGPDKGKVLELTPEEKVREAVKFHLTQNPEINGKKPFDGRHVNATVVELRHVETGVNGDPLGKQGFQNNVYFASGRSLLQLRDRQSDRTLPDQQIRFEIQFKDVLQENGLPDFKILDFQYQKE